MTCKQQNFWQCRFSFLAVLLTKIEENWSFIWNKLIYKYLACCILSFNIFIIFTCIQFCFINFDITLIKIFGFIILYCIFFWYTQFYSFKLLFCCYFIFFSCISLNSGNQRIFQIRAYFNFFLVNLVKKKCFICITASKINKKKNIFFSETALLFPET